MQHFNKDVHRKVRGFTLVEMLIVLAIGASVLFGVFVAVSAVQNQQASNEASENLNLFAAEIQTLFRGQSDFSDISNTVLLDAGTVPGPMEQGGEIVTAWNDEVEVTSVTLTGTSGTDNAFQIEYPLPEAACTNVIQAVEGAFAEVQVGGSIIKDANNRELDVPTLASECSSDGDLVEDVLFIQGR
ncbi:type 4 pilus major pilin [Thioalkalivibrio sp. ALE23]|uniref:type 4 pilus major pilin n=1 Tax=Thioalkalivibrio sp. ALE23 TaxID=1265495 RepID=UPI00037B888A|nr:type 4 pilus major pilin [Thioalkalivibrio sp. ALE23]